MQPKRYPSDQHEINIEQVDPNALYVIKKLQEAGHIAYLVGGSVRDLLVKKTPKDFDISTSAKPEEIKQIFKRKCLLIGRRFRLAHVRFGKKVIEVSTFRAGFNESELILHDNIWGTEEEDVLRRDFTINGLFYNPTDQTVIDYIGGLEDIHKGMLTTIGDPVMRFKQDPVRMIRLLKFRARFGFKIEPATKKALIQCREEITKSSPARILEEIYRMLESGASAPFFQLMTESWLLELLLPRLTRFLKSEQGKIIYHYLSVADQFNQKQEEPLHRAVLTACLLFPLLDNSLNKDFTEKNLTPNMGDIILHTNDIMKSFVTTAFSHFPRRLVLSTNFILHTQYRFSPLSKKHSMKPNMFHYKEFPLAMQFFKIRAAVEPNLRETYLHWNEHYMSHRKTAHHPHPFRKKKQHAS